MRPRIVRITAFILLGAVVNIAVAWGFAAYGPVQNTSRDWLTITDGWNESNVQWWNENYPFAALAYPLKPHTAESSQGEVSDEFKYARRTPPRTDYVRTGTMFGADFLSASGTSVDSERPSYATVLRSRWGAPFQSMMTVNWRRLSSGESIEQHSTPYLRVSVERKSAAWQELTFLFGERQLPLQPIWPGFLFNTLFYAAILWSLLAGPFALRRLIRRRRGQCERCAYPIGISPVCTECGAAIGRTVNA